MIDYLGNLKKIESFKVTWDTPMENITLNELYDKLSHVQSYRTSLVEMMKDALMEKSTLYMVQQTSEINYENKVKYTMITDTTIKKEAKSDKVREAMASNKFQEQRKAAFEDEKNLAKVEAYEKTLRGYLNDMDKQSETVQNQVFILNLDLKIHPDKQIRLS